MKVSIIRINIYIIYNIPFLLTYYGLNADIVSITIVYVDVIH